MYTPLPLHLLAALRQGDRIPIDQVGKFRERKQLLDKILAKDTEEMRNTCTVSHDYRGIPFSVSLHVCTYTGFRVHTLQKICYLQSFSVCVQVYMYLCLTECSLHIVVVILYMFH